METDIDDARAAEAETVNEAIPEKRMTAEEFLEWEAKQEARYEYVAGYAYPASGIRQMAGASRRHNRISINLLAAFHAHLRGKPFQLFGTDFQLRIEAAQEHFVYYPDLMVVGNNDDTHKNHLVNPKLIAEVLSPPTAREDRNQKFPVCREIPALDEYVLAAQSRPDITIYRRADNWEPTVVSSLEDSAEFRSIGLSLQMAQIYEGLF